MLELTFILLARTPLLGPDTDRVIVPDAIASCPMIGDVNLFLPDGTAGDVECEIMLAGKCSDPRHARLTDKEPSFRGKGYAREALSLLSVSSVVSALIQQSYLRRQ